MGIQYIGSFYFDNDALADSIECTRLDKLNNPTVYEVIRIVGAKPLFFEDHIARLKRSLIALGVNFNALDLQGIKPNIGALCEHNTLNFGNVEIRILIESNKIFKILVGFIAHKYPQALDYITGVSACLIKALRKNPNVKIKGTATREMADRKILESNNFEALLVNDEDCITEGSKSNVFFIKDKQVYTAPKQLILEGITRKYVINAISKLSVELVFEAVNIKDLPSFDAIFLCGTSPGVLPINSIDEQVFDSHNELVKQIIMGFNDEVVNYLRTS